MLADITHRLLWIFLLLNGCDILTTETGLILGGKEVNPIAKFLIDNLGHWGLYALKGVGLGITFIYWALQYKTNPSQVNTVLTIQNIMFAFVIVWNSLMILLGLLNVRLPQIKLPW